MAYLERGQRAIAPEWVGHVPLSSLPAFREHAPYYYEWLEHPNYDEYWARVDVESQWDKVDVPALVTGAWGDLFHIGFGARLQRDAGPRRVARGARRHHAGHDGREVVMAGRAPSASETRAIWTFGSFN